MRLKNCCPYHMALWCHSWCFESHLAQFWESWQVALEHQCCWDNFLTPLPFTLLHGYELLLPCFVGFAKLVLKSCLPCSGLLFSKSSILKSGDMEKFHRQHCLWVCSMWYDSWPIMSHLDQYWELQQAAYECLCFQDFVIGLTCFCTSELSDKIMLTTGVLS